jgi:hypothetical protein
MFAVAGHAGADSQIGAAIDQQFGDFGIRAAEVRERVKNGSLAADAVNVDVSASVHVGASVKEEASGVEKAVFSGRVRHSRANLRCLIEAHDIQLEPASYSQHVVSPPKTRETAKWFSNVFWRPSCRSSQRM